ncbi:hypothetical protein EC991_008994 [Linnemannia zychae]|nr:hypothetical protein EC991_008994 [Linnemannia zychae]
MQLVQNSPPGNPLDLSEIRTRIVNVLSRKDCVSCMRVSRDWFLDFAPAVWHTIDFDKDATALSSLSTEVLDKYAGFISQTILKTTENIRSLQHYKVDSIKLIKTMLPVEQRRWGRHYLHVNDLFPSFLSPLDSGVSISHGSRLRVLTLSRLCVTREGFSSLLRFSPCLDDLTLNQVLVMYHKPTIPIFTGSKLKYLHASLAEVSSSDNEDPSAPCLLHHFPLLEQWDITSLSQPSGRAIDIIELDVSAMCPLLKTITLGSKDEDAISKLLLNSFDGLQSCTLSAKNLTMSTAVGLVSQLYTLTSLIITDEMQDESSTQWLWLVLKLCRHLQFISLESIVCDLEKIGKHRLRCSDLRELRLRIQGFDTPEDIDRCIMQLCAWRRSCDDAETQFKETDSISTRVARHLLQFKKLTTVWFGTKDYYIRPSTA